MIRFLVLGSIALVVVCGGLREVLNALEKPALEEIRLLETGTDLVLYHHGRLNRSAVLFLRSTTDSVAQPRALVRVHYGETSPADQALLGELMRTRDGTAIYATGRTPDSPVLWILDLHTEQILLGRGAGGRSTPDGLNRILLTKRGPGEPIAKWYEMGAGSMDALYSWQTEHWERLSSGLQ